MKGFGTAWRRLRVAPALGAAPGAALGPDGRIEGVPTQIDVTDGSNRGVHVHGGSPTGGSG